MARISGFVVARTASRQCAAFCFQGVRMGQASPEVITYPLKFHGQWPKLNHEALGAVLAASENMSL
jgi:hypothetical protein